MAEEPIKAFDAEGRELRIYAPVQYGRFLCTVEALKENNTIVIVDMYNASRPFEVSGTQVILKSALENRGSNKDNYAL